MVEEEQDQEAAGDEMDYLDQLDEQMNTSRNKSKGSIKDIIKGLVQKNIHRQKFDIPKTQNRYCPSIFNMCYWAKYLHCVRIESLIFRILGYIQNNLQKSAQLIF